MRHTRPNPDTEEIWRYFDEFKVYMENAKRKDRIASWQGCRVSNLYYNPKGQLIGWDVIFPRRLYDRVAQLCGLPLRQKPPGRVAQGQRLGARATALRNAKCHETGDFPIVDSAQRRQDGQTTPPPSNETGREGSCRERLIS
jgi:hypothetical protein